MGIRCFHALPGETERHFVLDLRPLLPELDNLVDHLGLREKGFYLLGQSWGGILCGGYASRRPRGLKKAIISSGPASVPMYIHGLPEVTSGATLLTFRQDAGGVRSPGRLRESGIRRSRGRILRPSRLLARSVSREVQAAFKNLKDDPTSYLTM